MRALKKQKGSPLDGDHLHRLVRGLARRRRKNSDLYGKVQPLAYFRADRAAADRTRLTARKTDRIGLTGCAAFISVARSRVDGGDVATPDALSAPRGTRSGNRPTAPIGTVMFAWGNPLSRRIQINSIRFMVICRGTSSRKACDRARNGLIS